MPTPKSAATFRKISPFSIRLTTSNFRSVVITTRFARSRHFQFISQPPTSVQLSSQHVSQDLATFNSSHNLQLLFSCHHNTFRKISPLSIHLTTSNFCSVVITTRFATSRHFQFLSQPPTSVQLSLQHISYSRHCLQSLSNETLKLHCKQHTRHFATLQLLTAN
jgi:hypothetical protein